MKWLGCFICILVLIGIWEIAGAVERSDFQFKAPLTGSKKAGMPVRLALPLAVIAETARGLTDLRLFDDLGTEVPYCIYKQRRPEQSSAYFMWQILDYHPAGSAQTIIMERPKQGGTFNALTLNTTARDFHKDITAYKSDDRRSWKQIAQGMIFDFSSHINVRKTTLELPKVDARYLKVILDDRVRPMEQAEDIQLRYKDLEFTLSGLKTGEIKIDGFTSDLRPTNLEAPLFDYAIIPSPQTFFDKDKNTIVALGRVNLPIERASLKIKNTYYYRIIELWTSEKDEEKAYSRVAQDVVYHIPGVSDRKSPLAFNQPQQAYVRLKVINQDNPPLQIEEVTVEWVRLNLYFIPELGRLYTLYYGGKRIDVPHYELQKLVPNQYDQLMRYAEWTIGGFQKNEVYKPKADLRTKEKFEKYLFTVLVILLVCGLAFWAFRLMKKIPGSRSQ